MTLDLFFLDRAEGRTWIEAMEELDLADDGRPLSGDDLARWDAIVTAVEPLLPEAEPGAGDGSRCFDDPTTGIQVLFCPGEVSISVIGPGEHPAAGDEVTDALRRVVAAIEDRTGLVAYDPQRDRPYLAPADDAPSAEVHHLFGAAPRPDPDHPSHR